MTPSSSEDFSPPVAAELARRVEAAERQVRLLETVLAATDDYGFILDLQGRVLFANRNFLKLLGRTLDEVVGRDGHQLGFPAWHADMHRREVQQVAATRQPVRGEVPYTPPDGRFRWFEYRFAPVLNAQNEVEVIAGSSRDITERRQSEAMDRFLVALDDAIRPLGHERDISLTCARLLGDKLGVERCAYAYFEDEDIMILGDHVRGVPSIVGRYRLRDFGVEAAEHMRRNQPFVVNDIETHQPPIGDLAPYRALGIHATIATPLHKEGRLVAGIAVQQKQPRQWTAADILLVKAVAGRCWESIERARVAEALRAREQLYRSLSEISEVARSESDPALIMRSALRKVAALLGATRCAYADVAADEEHFTIRDDYTAEGYTSSTGDYRLSGFGQKVPAEQRAGQCSVVRDVEHELGVDGAGLLSLQIRAIICCPLIRRGKLVAMMAVHQAAPRNWSASEIALFHTAVERCWAEVERAQVARALAESERQFRQLADAMPQIVFTALPDGTVDYFNRRWYEYTGFPEDGRMGDESWVGVHEPEALSRVAQTWAESLRTGRPYEIEYRLRRHDGMWRWHLGRALPVRDAAGNVIRWFGTNTDIHEQRTLLEENQHLLESEREARSEAERVGRMKDEFLATLSHELRTPLAAIVGWTEVLRQDTEGTPLAEAVETIARNADAQSRIVDDLLDMNRITSGKLRLDIQPVDLDTIAKASVETLRPAAEAKGVQLLTVLDPRVGTTMGDPNRLQQVFWNLLSNAIKFTPKGGRVQMVLRRFEARLEINITDTGEGIAPEFLPYVFDRFRQADGSTTRRHGGLGIGLAIVRQLVELHGGEVGVTSPGPGQGATFTVSFPINAVQPVAVARPAHPAAATLRRDHTEERFDGLTALVVDDEPDARLLLRRLLEDRGASVLLASSAAEAFTLLVAQRPDVVVSDIGMPVEDGYSFLGRVRALAPADGGITPAIALTAYARPADRIQAMRAGFQLHLVKPVDPAELFAAIVSLIARPAAKR